MRNDIDTLSTERHGSIRVLVEEVYCVQQLRIKELEEEVERLVKVARDVFQHSMKLSMSMDELDKENRRLN